MDPETEKITAIRDELVAWLDDHRAHCTEAGCGEPANTLAFLAHALGVKHDRLEAVQRRMMDYEANCPNCPHLRN